MVKITLPTQIYSFERSSTEKGAPDCGLSFTIPESMALEFDSIDRLKLICLAINESPYEKNSTIFICDADHSTLSADDVASLCMFVQSQGMVFLLRQSHVDNLGKADGVLLSNTDPLDHKKIARYRKEMQDDQLILAVEYEADALVSLDFENSAQSNVDLLVITPSLDQELAARDKNKIIRRALAAWRSCQNSPVMVQLYSTPIYDAMVADPLDYSEELVEAGVSFIEVNHLFALQRDELKKSVAHLLRRIDRVLTRRAMH